MAGGDETAHVYDSVFLGRHCHAVGEAEHLAHNLFDSLVGIAFLAGLDEIGIFGEAGRVEYHAQAMTVGELAHGAQVGHRHGLSAGGVVGDSDNDKGHVSGLCHSFFELVDIYIALEGMFELSVAGLIDSAVYGKGAAALYMAFSGVEV